MFSILWCLARSPASSLVTLMITQGIWPHFSGFYMFTILFFYKKFRICVVHHFPTPYLTNAVKCASFARDGGNRSAAGIGPPPVQLVRALSHQMIMMTMIIIFDIHRTLCTDTWIFSFAQRAESSVQWTGIIQPCGTVGPLVYILKEITHTTDIQKYV
jgi:hypothetical protein